MKSVILAVCLVALAGVKAFALTETVEEINDSITSYVIAVASSVIPSTAESTQVSTATLASGATTFQNLLENRTSISLQNLSTTANISCRVGLSSTSANGDLSLSPPAGLSTTVGTKVGPGGLLTISTRARDQNGRVFIPFCVNDGAVGTTNIEVIQTRSK